VTPTASTIVSVSTTSTALARNAEATRKTALVVTAEQAIRAAR